MNVPKPPLGGLGANIIYGRIHRQAGTLDLDRLCG